MESIMDIIWKWQHFSELTTQELYSILRLRQLVFVLEQHCLYQDIDEKDPKGFHLSAWSPSCTAIPHAYLRVLPEQNSTIRIGRLVTHPEYRGQGLGGQMLQHSLDRIEQHWSGATIQLSAQQHLEGFYRKFGFLPVSDVFLEDNIPHVEMIRMSNHA